VTGRPRAGHGIVGVILGPPGALGLLSVAEPQIATTAN